MHVIYRKKLKNNILCEICIEETEEKEGYEFVKLTYPNGEVIDFGKALAYYDPLPGFYGLTYIRDKYVFSYILSGALPRIFDMEEKIEIIDRDTRYELEDKYFKSVKHKGLNLLRTIK